MKKLLIAVLSVVLIVVIGISSVQLIPVFKSIDWSSLGGHFDKAEEKFSLSVSSDEGGTVSATESQYTAGTVVDLVATPNEGYIFTGWYTGDDTYLTTSKNYSFAIDKDTVLRAGFVLAPESMEGEYNHFEELKNCSENFSFTIQCDEPDAETYLANNLVIVDTDFLGTEWEELVRNEFIVERIGDTNEYKISLAGDSTYEPGTTYTAYLLDAETPDDDTPGTDTPGTDTPGTDTPGTDTPGTDTPGTDTPGTDTPGTDTPGTDTPGTDTPILPDEDDNDDYDVEDDGNDDEVVETPNTSFVDVSNDSASMSFTIEKEETEVVEYNTGIVYLYDSANKNKDQVISVVDDGLSEGEDGDVADHVVLNKKYGITVDSIFCVYYNVDENGDPVIDSDAFFAKAKSVENLSSGGVKVVYTSPSLAEIFEKLDIYTKGNLNLEDQGAAVNDEVVEEIKYLIFTNENFVMYLANVYEASENALAGTDCEIETIGKTAIEDLISVSATTSIKSNVATVDIEIEGNIPINKGKEQVAAISFKMTVSKEITLTYGANLKLKKHKSIPCGVSSYDFWVGVQDKETLSFAINAVGEDGVSGLENLEKNLSEEMARLKKGKGMHYNKVKDEFEKQGYDLEVNKTVSLFDVEYKTDTVEFDFNVKFVLRFEAGTTLQYSETSNQETTLGIRSSGAKGPQVYKGVAGKATVDKWSIAGEFDARVGLLVKTHITMAGFAKNVKLDLEFQSGADIGILGCGSDNRGYYAAKIDRDSYFKIDADSKVFEEVGSWRGHEEKKSISSYGYDKAIVSYADQTLNNSTLSILESNTKLFDLAKLQIKVINLKSGSITTQNINAASKHHTIDVSFKSGEWLSYDANTGSIIVKAGAPLYFEDAITIKISSASNSWGKHEKNKVYVSLPAITLNIEYGNEDAYYDFLDNAIQKEFRRIYRSYNETNAKVLKDNFKNIIDNAIKIPEKYAGVFDVIVMEYIDRLFNMITEYSALEDDKRTMENRFVASEANAFNSIFEYMNALIDSKSVNKKSTFALLDMTLGSVALYGTIVNVAESEDCSILAENFKRVPEETKAAILEVMEEFLDNYHGTADEEKAEKLADAFKKVLSLDADANK